MQVRAVVFLLSAVMALSPTGAFAACERWTSYLDTELYYVSAATVGATATAYTYRILSIAIDADGAPNAYNPQNTGLDDYGNANYPNGHWQAR